MDSYRKSLIERISNLPASICPEAFSDFTLRGEGRTHIEWDTDMLIDAGVPVDRLRELCTMLENRAEFMKLT